MNGLTGFQRDILYVIAGLADTPALEIKEELQGANEMEITQDRLYPCLHRLIEKGFIEEGTPDESTDMYTLTEQGKREIATQRKWENKYLTEELLTDRPPAEL